MRTSEPQHNTETELAGIAWLSAKNKHQVFHSLMHHVNEESLTACYQELDGKKALGADGVSKEIYGLHLRANLEKLILKMKRMAYRPGPVRQVQIPKEGARGATRNLGISNFEDKLVQKQMQKILESIYEPLFLECSYGFRPNRGCHNAIKDLRHHLYKTDVEIVLDVDLKDYFNTIDHQKLEEILQVKIKDTKFNRYISRMLKAGVLKQGEFMVGEEGVVQGSCCSPVLANIFAHYVLDEWLEEIVKPRLKGNMRMFRYGDDCVICFQYEVDAHKVMAVLPKRLSKYNLRINLEKTKLIAFSKTKLKGNIRQGTFDFLGFTWYLGKSRLNVMIPKLKTSRKRMNTKLNRVTQWIREIRCKHSLNLIWKTFCAKLRGHVQYYGVSFNSRSVATFLYQATRIMFKWLNRRSQKKSFDWGKFNKYIKQHPLPDNCIYHKLF